MSNYFYYRKLATGCYKQAQVAKKPEVKAMYERWFNEYQARAKNEL